MGPPNSHPNLVASEQAWWKSASLVIAGVSLVASLVPAVAAARVEPRAALEE